MARLTETKNFNKDASRYAVKSTDHIGYIDYIYSKDGFGIDIKLRHTDTYLFGPAIDKLADYENIRDNPQEIREELHKGQIAWNENFNLRAELDRLSFKITVLQNENRSLKKENEDLKTATLAHDIVTLLDERDALKRENDNLIKTIECRDGRIDELIDEIDKLKDELASYDHFTTLKNKQIGKLYEKVESLKKSNAAKDEEIERLQKRIDNLKDALLAD